MTRLVITDALERFTADRPFTAEATSAAATNAVCTP
jgi:hypothetical protein